MSNPISSVQGSYYDPNYKIYQPGYNYPINLDVIVWPAGFGSDAAVVGPGNMGSVSAQLVNTYQTALASATLPYIDLLPLFAPAPLIFPYKNWRSFVFSVADDSWNTAGLIIDIVGKGVDFQSVTDQNAVATAGSQVTNTVLVQIDHIYLSGNFTAPVTCPILFDMGYFGQTAPFTSEPKCSSWTASLQVTVPLTGSQITYTPYNDNFPRDVQTNTMPSMMSDWYSQYGVEFIDDTTFQMLDILQTQPYPAIGEQNSTSIIKPVPYAVQNIYLTISDDNTKTDDTGTLLAIFLQDSIWFK